MGLYVFTIDDENRNNHILRNKIKVCRAEKNLSQKELAKLIDVTRQTVAVIEKGNHPPSLPVALKIACVFGKKLEDIFYYEVEENNEEIIKFIEK